MITLLILLLLTGYRCFEKVGVEKRPAGDYDEQMWTGVSITSYCMAFQGYERQNVVIERVFRAYVKDYRYDISGMPPRELQWFDDPLWSVGWKAPNIGKYIMGFFIVNFGEDVDPDGYFYRYSPDKKENKWPGSYAPAGLLELARTANAIMATMTILLLFYIGHRFFGFWAGVLASGYLLFNEVFLSVNTAARITGPSIFFSTLTLYFCLRFVEQVYEVNRKRLLYSLSIAIGISFSLAVGSKLNAALIGYVPIVFSIVAVVALIKLPIPGNTDIQANPYRLAFIQNILICAGITTTITVFVFIYHNPALYTDSIFKIKLMYEHGRDYYGVVFAKALNSTHISESWMNSLWLLIKRNAFRVEDLYYGTIGSIIKVNYNFLDGLLCITGCFFMLKESWSVYRKTHQLNTDFFLVIWFVVILWGTVDFIWIDWDRYHLPVYPAYALIISVGLVRTMEHLFNRKRTSDTDIEYGI